MSVIEYEYVRYRWGWDEQRYPLIKRTGCEKVIKDGILIEKYIEVTVEKTFLFFFKYHTNIWVTPNQIKSYREEITCE